MVTAHQEFEASTTGGWHARRRSQPEEAVSNVQDAIAAWIEAAHDLGHAVPQPSRRFAPVA
jgi:predicted RNase H-like HicB family nuclease